MGNVYPLQNDLLQFKTLKSLFTSPALLYIIKCFAQFYTSKKKKIPQNIVFSSSSFLPFYQFFYLYMYWEEGIYKYLRLTRKPQRSDKKFITFQFS